MKYFLSALGWVFAKLPERAVDLLCVCVGWLIYAAPFGRARVARANIARAFPDMPEKEIDKTVFESARRMVEMALFVVASPHISTENLRGRVELSDKVKAEFEGFGKNPEPAVLMIPHFAMMETITMFPILVDGKVPPTGVFYRPFDNAGIEEWVRTSRHRFGIEFLSRKKGLHAAVAFLRQNGCVAVLFDQKVFSGTRTLLLDKICYTTELPGILAENTGAAVGAFWAERTGFWRARIDCKRFSSRTIEEITCEGNEWLTEKLRADAVSRYDWLWLHKRWHYVEREGRLLGLRESYKSVVDLALSRMGRSELPRNFRGYITLPDSLGECVSLLPLVRLLR
ncbi:MAG: hypothetical protein IJI37_08045, partial [Opitutales bacterium]|nr:hypothetical protein [Opitutales bacterium]